MANKNLDFNSRFADLEKIKKDDAAKEQGTMEAIASTIKVTGNPFEDEDDASSKTEGKHKEEKKAVEKKKSEPVKEKSYTEDTEREVKPLLQVDQLFSKNPVKPVKIASFSLDADVLQAIDKYARRNNLSKSKVVNEILKNVLL